MFGSFFTRSSRSSFVVSKFTGAALLLGLLALSGCDGSSSGGATTPNLQSIEITPTNPSLAAGTSTQLTATAIHNDNSHADVTSQVIWASATTSVATISNAAGSNGLASSAAAGNSAITAAMGGITSAPVTLP